MTHELTQYFSTVGQR